MQRAQPQVGGVPTMYTYLTYTHTCTYTAHTVKLFYTLSPPTPTHVRTYVSVIGGCPLPCPMYARITYVRAYERRSVTYMRIDE